MHRSSRTVFMLICYAACTAGFAAERDENLVYSFVYCAEIRFGSFGSSGGQSVSPSGFIRAVRRVSAAVLPA